MISLKKIIPALSVLSLMALPTVNLVADDYGDEIARSGGGGGHGGSGNWSGHGGSGGHGNWSGHGGGDWGHNNWGHDNNRGWDNGRNSSGWYGGVGGVGIGIGLDNYGSSGYYNSDYYNNNYPYEQVYEYGY